MFDVFLFLCCLTFKWFNLSLKLVDLHFVLRVFIFCFTWIFDQGGLQYVVFVWPVAWQLLHTHPQRLESVTYSFSSWLSFCSASFTTTICTCKIVRLSFISCCFESNRLHPCWSFWADVGLACASSAKLADGKADSWNDSCLGCKQLTSSPDFSCQNPLASFCTGTRWDL